MQIQEFFTNIYVMPLLLYGETKKLNEKIDVHGAGSKPKVDYMFM